MHVVITSAHYMIQLVYMIDTYTSYCFKVMADMYVYQTCKQNIFSSKQSTTFSIARYLHNCSHKGNVTHWYWTGEFSSYTDLITMGTTPVYNT